VKMFSRGLGTARELWLRAIRRRSTAGTLQERLVDALSDCKTLRRGVREARRGDIVRHPLVRRS